MRKLKVDDYELAVFQSLARIELLSKLILEVLTNSTKANNIYKEVCDTVSKEIPENKLYEEE